MSADVDVLITAPITFDVGDEIVHSPMVHARVGGVPTKLILDTGASDHVFTAELARRTGLEPGDPEPGFDHSGDPVPSFMLGDVGIQVGDATLPLHGVVEFDGPPAFERWGIGGFLSPQSVHPEAWVVIDLAANELILVMAAAPEVSSWLASRSPERDVVSLRRVDHETVAVEGVAIEPFDPVTTMLNTGSSGSEFAAAAVPGLRGRRPDQTGYGLSGSAVDGEEVAGQVLRVGDRRFALPTLLIREEMPPPPGLIGMDVLAGTVLAVSSRLDDPVLWLVPPDRATPGEVPQG